MLRSHNILALALACTSVVLLTSAVCAQTVPTGFVVDTLVTGLHSPNDCCFLPDGRVLIADTDGTVTIYGNGASAAVGMVPNVEWGGERGLLSIAADPAFPTNGHVYAYYSSTLDAFMHLDRFTCTGDLANAASTNLSFVAASRCVVLDTLPDNWGNHNGGSVRFGPDGMLYLTVGDDFVACDAQSLTSQVGCLLRLETGGLPAGGNTTAPSFALLDPGDNPLSAKNDFRQLVIGYGLRNPFRMEIDPATGNLYIGDVGESTEEEYSEYVYPAGALPLVNFGWPWREGAIAGFSCTGLQPPGLMAPIASVSQGTGWASVMGGARYRNQGGAHDFGPGYEGSAFYLDYFAGEVRRLVNTGTWGPAPPVPGQPSTANWGTGFSYVTSLRLGPDGCLWFTQHSFNSELKRIRSLGPINSFVAVSGDGQVVPHGEPAPLPLVVQLRDPQGNPMRKAPVRFTATASVALSTTNPVFTDANGLAQTTVLAAIGGAFSVTASAGGTPSNATFSLFGRQMQALASPGQLVLVVTNTTTAVPAQVPCIVFASLPGSPVLQTPFGPMCTDPSFPRTIVMEDSVGLYGGVSLSGTGAVGAPGFVSVYALPPGKWSGLLMSFQAIGIDPITGWFRTNCETKQF